MQQRPEPDRKRPTTDAGDAFQTSYERLVHTLNRQLVEFDDGARLPKLFMDTSDVIHTIPDGRAGATTSQTFSRASADGRTVSTVPGLRGSRLFARPPVLGMTQHTIGEDDVDADPLGTDMQFLAGVRPYTALPTARPDNGELDTLMAEVEASVTQAGPVIASTPDTMLLPEFWALDVLPLPAIPWEGGALGTLELPAPDAHPTEETLIPHGTPTQPPTVVYVFGLPRRLHPALLALSAEDIDELVESASTDGIVAPAARIVAHALLQVSLYLRSIGAVSKRREQSQRAVDRQRRVVNSRIVAQTGRAVTTRLIRIGNAQQEASALAGDAAREIKRRRRAAHPSVSVMMQHTKMKRVAREAGNFWRRYGKDLDSEQRVRERREEEQQRRAEEERERLRQRRKLAFLLKQTDLYTHFMKGKPMEAAGPEPADTDDAAAVQAAQTAARTAQDALKTFDAGHGDELDTETLDAPKMLTGTLKPYQLVGLRWLANLYEQGINGILADDMGLGKTFQSISFIAHLVERRGIWGPFLIISPNSTLHNWMTEIAKFCPDLRARPYWGSKEERTKIRNSWTVGRLGTKGAPFHVVVTSYHNAVNDKQLAKIRWQYMILDEAQAIKSAASQRWTALLKYECRNRLLLSGTPVQNNMQELWALLHFCMPTLFDSNSEFTKWFARDLEASAKQKSIMMDPTMLKRLHKVLKPFMLRREKKDVVNELGMKVEKNLHCTMTETQRALMGQLSRTAQSAASRTETNLLNIVMQYRKACNHPQLFGRPQPRPAFVVSLATPNGPARDTTVISPSRGPAISMQVPVAIIDLIRETEHCRVGPARAGPVDLWRQCLVDSPDITWVGTRPVQRHPAPSALLHLAGLCGLTQSAVAAIGRGEVPTRAAAFVAGEFLSDILVRRPVALSVSEARRPVTSVLRRDPVTVLNAIAAPPAMWASTSRVTTALPLRAVYQSAPRSAVPGVPVHWPSTGLVISVCGKMGLLDQLLADCRRDKHRCLLYCQMTKMMDILEDFLSYRGYSFVRFDGSSSLEDRRDLVDDFQTNDDIFVFLLSTRAGGLGINLTAADTVVFYDSDWNPTVDSQAMDRCHRLGQTKQVTVYRLVTDGTIEEDVLVRAESKGMIQDLVMGGQREMAQRDRTMADILMKG